MHSAPNDRYTAMPAPPHRSFSASSVAYEIKTLHYRSGEKPKNLPCEPPQRFFCLAPSTHSASPEPVPPRPPRAFLSCFYVSVVFTFPKVTRNAHFRNWQQAKKSANGLSKIASKPASHAVLSLIFPHLY